MTSAGTGGLFNSRQSVQALGVTTELHADLGQEEEAIPPFAQAQKPPSPPRNPAAANAAIAAALREGNPEGDSLPREDGAPYRD